MKLIVATVCADKLEAIQNALTEPDAYILYVFSVGDVRESLAGSYRGLAYQSPRPRLRLEIAVVNECMVQDTVAIIARTACGHDSGPIGNGSIFVTPLEEWVCIPADPPQSLPIEDKPITCARKAW